MLRKLPLKKKAVWGMMLRSLLISCTKLILTRTAKSAERREIELSLLLLLPQRKRPSTSPCSTRFPLVMSQECSQLRTTSPHSLRTLLKEDMHLFSSPPLLSQRPSLPFSKTWLTSRACTTTPNLSSSSPKMPVLEAEKSSFLTRDSAALVTSTPLLLSSSKCWLRTRDLCISMALPLGTRNSIDF